MRDGGEDAGAVARVVVARTGAAVIQTRRQHAGVAQNLFQTTPREKKTKKTLRNNQRLMDFVCVCVCGFDRKRCASRCHFFCQAGRKLIGRQLHRSSQERDAVWDGASLASRAETPDPLREMDRRRPSKRRGVRTEWKKKSTQFDSIDRSSIRWTCRYFQSDPAFLNEALANV